VDLLPPKIDGRAMRSVTPAVRFVGALCLRTVVKGDLHAARPDSH